MTTYRDLVQRALSVCHANLEMGLAHAREQEPFILRVSALLDKFGVTNRVQLAVAVAECAVDDVAR